MPATTVPAPPPVTQGRTLTLIALLAVAFLPLAGRRGFEWRCGVR
ncbi:hypothetical protein [Actinoallomurus vinaceus]